MTLQALLLSLLLILSEDKWLELLSNLLSKTAESNQPRSKKKLKPLKQKSAKLSKKRANKPLTKQVSSILILESSQSWDDSTFEQVMVKMSYSTQSKWHILLA